MNADPILVAGVVLAGTTAVSAAVVWPARAVAVRCGIIDNPGHRKVHAVPMARTGGIAVFLAFTLVVGLWWIYAGRVNTADMRTVRGGIAQPYLYSQFLVVLGVGTCSIGIRALGEGHREALTLLAAGVFFWIGGLVLIRAVVLRHRDRYWYIPFAGALLLVPALAAAGLPPLVTFALFDAIVLVLLAIELRHGRGHAGPVHRL